MLMQTYAHVVILTFLTAISIHSLRRLPDRFVKTSLLIAYSRPIRKVVSALCGISLAMELWASYV